MANVCTMQLYDNRQSELKNEAIFVSCFIMLVGVVINRVYFILVAADPPEGVTRHIILIGNRHALAVVWLPR